MEIPIIIPWGEGDNLGGHYNRIMADIKDWVCFLDHDILHMNPQWYPMIKSAVKRVGHRAGWITGMTNAIACIHQLSVAAPKNQNIESHMQWAKKLYNKYGNQLDLIDPSNVQLPFSGFMILTHRKAWEDAGGFAAGFLGVDNEYFKAITQKGYNAYVMPGLYMYHIYRLKAAWNTY